MVQMESYMPKGNPYGYFGYDAQDTGASSPADKEYKPRDQSSYGSKPSTQRDLGEAQPSEQPDSGANEGFSPYPSQSPFNHPEEG